MILLLHGWLLEGSGSNLWTRSILRSLCSRGETVHVMCQENHPRTYDFIAEARTYRRDGSVETVLRRDVSFPGRCILHRPELGDTLPVFVWDKYEGFTRVVPMVDLRDDEIEAYVQWNTDVATRIVRENDIEAVHANHPVLMAVVAQRIRRLTGIPYAVMPHGSEIEYAVKKDARFHRFASAALLDSGKVFLIGEEMRQRVRTVFPDVPGIEQKLSELHLGVDTSEFEPLARNQRTAAIERICDGVADLPRGKTREQTSALKNELSWGSDGELSAAALRRHAGYEAKRPDADIEDKLRKVNWVAGELMLFVGRLIAAKGIQSVIAALPLILRERPNAQLIVVGHGPAREVMELLLFALASGERQLANEIVRRGRELEGDISAVEAGAGLSEVTSLFAFLEDHGAIDDYFDAAATHIRDTSVVFTGYLTHNELKHLFPCCDVGLFPSVVREAGPLVFLEALASGCFPLGTYFGGMRASIDNVSGCLEPAHASLMKLDPERTAYDIAGKAPQALTVARLYAETLNRIARERFDWSAVSAKLTRELRALAASADQAVSAG